MSNLIYILLWCIIVQYISLSLNALAGTSDSMKMRARSCVEQLSVWRGHVGTERMPALRVGLADQRTHPALCTEHSPAIASAVHKSKNLLFPDRFTLVILTNNLCGVSF